MAMPAAAEATDGGGVAAAAASHAQEVLPLHRRGREVHRLQGSRHAQGLRHRDGQDRPEPHHRHEVASISASSRSRSSARASWRCCRTPTSTEAASMEVILLQKVANLGNIGDRVKVRSGYGRNFLLPQGKATLATPDNVARFEARRAELEKPGARAPASAEERAAAHEGLQAHDPPPRPAPKASSSARSAPATSPRPAPRRASRSSAAKCACRTARCVRSASTWSACTCTPTSTCR